MFFTIFGFIDAIFAGLVLIYCAYKRFDYWVACDGYWLSLSYPIAVFLIGIAIIYETIAHMPFHITMA